MWHCLQEGEQLVPWACAHTNENGTSIPVGDACENCHIVCFDILHFCGWDEFIKACAANAILKEKALAIKANLAAPGTHKVFNPESVTKLIGTCMKIDRKAMGKTSKQMREILCTQRLSKEGMRGLQSVALDPTTGAIVVEDVKKEISEEDINAPRLWLFPHPDETQYQVTFSTFVQVGRKNEILSAKDSGNLYDEHALDAYLHAVSAEAGESGWKTMRSQESFPTKSFETFVSGFHDWQNEQRKRRELRGGPAGKPVGDAKPVAAGGPSPSKLVGRASASFIIESEEAAEAAAAEESLHRDLAVAQMDDSALHDTSGLEHDEDCMTVDEEEPAIAIDDEDEGKPMLPKHFSVSECHKYITSKLR